MSPSRTTSSPSSVSTSSSSSTGIATHSVQVGLDHRYNPDTIIANVGDKIGEQQTTKEKVPAVVLHE